MAEPEKTPEEKQDEVIQKTLEGFLDRTLSLRAIAMTQLKHARDNQVAVESELTKAIDDAVALWTPNESDSVARARAVNSYLDSTKELEVLRAFPHDAMLAHTLFVFIFAGLDAFLNQLLRILFTIRPELLNAFEAREASESNKPDAANIAARSVSLTDVLERSREEIVNSVIERVNDSLLRKSYIESFDKLASRFEATTLKDFKNWSKFVECSQRRNLIAHCDGMVNEQYLSNCKAAGVDVTGVTQNQKLGVTTAYLYEAIEIVAETGLKVGQVLWRRLRDSSLDAADIHLGNLIFELLKREQWELARRMGEFGQECAKRKYAKPRSERLVKIILINHAQAAKWSGDDEAAAKIVDGADWSGSSLDFCLAVACMKRDWKKAAELMRQLGKLSEIMPARAYYNWPIFREFRETVEFLAMFKEVFGVEFADDIQRKDDGSIYPPNPNPDTAGE